MSLTNNKLRFLTLAILAFFIVAGASSCKKEEGCTDPTANNYDPDAEKDNGSCDYSYAVPDEYSFEGQYGGQTVRLLLLKDLASTINEATTRTVTESELVAIYENSNGLYSSISTGKNLSGKISGVSTDAQIRDWFNRIEALSGPSGTYVDTNGVDLKQMVEKTLMGSVLYYRAVTDYLNGLSDDDNSDVTPGEGTAMEHHWDEAFGYFGAARDYNTYTDDEIITPGSKDSDGNGSIDPASEQNFFYAQTAAKRDKGAAALSASSQTDFTAALFQAFVRGRAAIGNDDFETRDAQVGIIKENWEKIIAATVIHYINETRSDIANSGADLNKHWAEMKGYLNMIAEVNNELGGADLQQLNNLVGEKPADATETSLNSAADLIASTYGFSTEQKNNW